MLKSLCRVWQVCYTINKTDAVIFAKGTGKSRSG